MQTLYPLFRVGIILFVSLACQDTNELAERPDVKQTIGVDGASKASIKLTFGFGEGEDGVTLMVCGSLEASEGLKGRQFKMSLLTLREGQYDGDTGTRPDGSRSGMWSNPKFFEIPRASGVFVSEMECLGALPYSKRISVEWDLEGEDGKTIVVSSPVYRVSATADRSIMVVEEIKFTE